MIDLIFQIFNLLIASFLAVYGFKKYLRPSLRGKLEQEKLELHNLCEAHLNLIQEQKDLETVIQKQKKECAQLTQKIDQWKNEVLYQENLRNQRIQEQQEKLSKLLEEQAKNYEFKQASKVISKQLMPILENELKSYFDEQNNIDHYMVGTIKQLRKVQKV